MSSLWYSCLTYLILKVTNGTHEVIDHYPKKIPQIDKSVPKNVADDYVEAMSCFDVKAYKACVVMCRRALQASAIEKGAKKNRLVEQLEDLKNNDIITKDLFEWATEIRLEGNIGAHPDKDGLKDVTIDDAQAILHFVEEYLKYVYERLVDNVLMPCQAVLGGKEGCQYYSRRWLGHIDLYVVCQFEELVENTLMLCLHVLYSKEDDQDR